MEKSNGTALMWGCSSNVMDKTPANPCPFCGGEAQMLRTKDMSGWWYGECTKCYARQIASETEEEATAAWNKRADAQP